MTIGRERELTGRSLVQETVIDRPSARTIFHLRPDSHSPTETTGTVDHPAISVHLAIQISTVLMQTDRCLHDVTALRRLFLRATMDRLGEADRNRSILTDAMSRGAVRGV